MRKLLLTLAALLLLLVGAGTVWAEETSVSTMDTVCTVAEDGSCQVVLHFRVELSADTDSFSVPVSPKAEHVTAEGGRYSVTEGGKYTTVRFTDLRAGSTELWVSYSLAETVTPADGEQLFRVTLLYPDWNCAISNYRAEIHLPKPFEEMPTILSGYYQDLIDNYMDIQINEGTISAALIPSQSLLDHETLSLSLKLPEDYFDLRFLAGKTVAADRLVFLILTVLTAAYWVIFLRSRPILPKRQAMPPEGGNAGAVPFVLTGRKADLDLMVVQWAALGYLTIHRKKNGKILLKRQIEMSNERKDFEVVVFRSLFGRSDTCSVSSGEYLRARSLAAEKTKRYWNGRLFRARGNPTVLRLLAVAAGLAICLACFDACVAPRSWRWYVIIPLTLAGGGACWLLQWIGGCLLRRHPIRTAALALAGAIFLLVAGGKGGQGFLMLLCILLQILVGMALRCGGRRSKVGKAMASELLGYRRYLLTMPDSTAKANVASDPQFFYRTLPYAEALQVGRIFSGSFDRLQLEPCDWLDWEGKPTKTARGFYARFVRLLAGLRGERVPLLYRPRRRLR